MVDFGTSNSKLEVKKSNSENYVTSEAAVSHNVLYYQLPPLLITMLIIILGNYQ